LGAVGVDGMAVRSAFRSDSPREDGNEHVSSRTRRTFVHQVRYCRGGSRVELEWTKYVYC
jgi:hypothetical protein